jgi:3-deoxy-manno-octulosonate cytidylyltransferase (CMP-KDO synthetase)
MVHWVYKAACQTPLLHEVLVATDSKDIEESCKRAGINVIVTGTHPSGTDRLHEVMLRIEADVYVNIQGDEPMLRPEHFELLIPPVTRGDAQVSTLKVAMDQQAAQDPNRVKVVTNTAGKALYFSRHPVPFRRDEKAPANYYKHIGIYAYHREALQLFYSRPQSPLELSERLEQLRFLENGIPIQVIETAHDTIGVDTEEDLRQVEAILCARG